MGGIYIKGMEMPTAGLYIVSVDNTNGQDKTIATVMRMFCIRDIQQLVGTFELVNVPEHGELKDADAIERNLLKMQQAQTGPCSHGIRKSRAVLRDAPTIIPASEEETK